MLYSGHGSAGSYMKNTGWKEVIQLHCGHTHSYLGQFYQSMFWGSVTKPDNTEETHIKLCTEIDSSLDGTGDPEAVTWQHYL